MYYVEGKGQEYSMAKDADQVLTPPLVRPLGVRLGAVLLLLFGIFGLLGAFAGLLIQRGHAILTVFYLLDALISAAELVSVWGLWKLKSWAFWATLCIEVVCIVIALIVFAIWRDTTSLATNLVFPVAILLCLFLDPRVRATFVK
jgi:hypothetical protein